MSHRKLINQFIRANQQLLNDSLRSLLLRIVPKILDFDNKRLLFWSQIKKTHRRFRLLKSIDLKLRRDKAFDDSFE